MNIREPTQKVYFLGSLHRYHDANMSYETTYRYRTDPVERAKFSSVREGDLWHNIVQQIVDVNENLQHYLESGRDPVTLCLEVLELLDFFVDSWGKALMPLVLRRIAHELREQFHLPSWDWPPILVIVVDDVGVPRARVPSSVDRFGSELVE